MRPSTALARPRTTSTAHGRTVAPAPAPAPASSRAAPDRAGAIFVAVVENQRREVGVAAYDMAAGRMTLHQFADRHLYRNLVTKLALYEPSEVLLCDTCSAQLDGAIRAQLGASGDTSTGGRAEDPTARIVSVARRYFNDSRGQLVLTQAALPECKSGLAEAGSKYLALAAAAALIKYVEFSQRLSFAANSLHVAFRALEGSLALDAATARNLELVLNAATRTKHGSLYGLLDHTVTRMGSRLLRTNLLVPCNDASTITTRLDALDELLGKPVMTNEVLDILRTSLAGIDLERLLGRLVVVVPVGHSAAAAAAVSDHMISSLLALKAVLGSLAPLCEALTPASNILLTVIRDNAADGSLAKLREDIDAIIAEEASYSRQAPLLRAQKCFAIKPNVHGLLDVSRSIFSETYAEIQALAQAYREQYGMAELKLKWAKSRGFFFSLARKHAPRAREAFPREFVQLALSGGSWTMTSKALSELSLRNTDTEQEIYLMTERVLTDLLAKVRTTASSLYRLAESLALLDMLLAFATHVARSPEPYVRPDISDDPLASLAIYNGRHALIERLHGSTAAGAPSSFVPNNAFSDVVSSFHLVTGPNMAGKSTYIRQIALLVVLGHVGCYVPAEHASLPCIDQLFTRIGTEDSLEANASTFTVEMQELAAILRNATARSLVIVDELGRATGMQDGIGIAWAAAERLLSVRAHTFFVTHFAPMRSLAELYPEVELLHLAGAATARKFKVQDGVCTQTQYGIELAGKAGFPNEVLALAQEMARRLASASASASTSSEPISSGTASTTQRTRQLVQVLRGMFIASGDSAELLEQLAAILLDH